MIRDQAHVSSPLAATAVWVLLVCALVGATLNDTHPYQGDETYYIKSAIAMVKGGDALVPQADGTVRLQKPVLAYWLTAAGYEAFGISLWAGRLPFLALAAALLMVVWRFARRLDPDPGSALLAVILLSSSMLFLLFSRVSMTDLPLALCSTLALHYFWRGLHEERHRQRSIRMAWLAMGAGVWAKGPLAVMPLAAAAAFASLESPAGVPKRLALLFAPGNLLSFALVAAPWYVYVAAAFPGELRTQFARKAADNVGPGLSAMPGHLLFYAGALLAYQLPAAALTAWVWIRSRRVGLGPHRWHLLAWYAGLNLAAFVVLFSHHRDRYVLQVVPVLALMMAGAIQQGGVARQARRLAAAAAIAQIAAIGVYAGAVGRPLHDLIGWWGSVPRGGLAVHGLTDREATWASAVSGGRLAPPGDRVPFVLAPATERDAFPAYDVLRRASRASGIEPTKGHVIVRRREFILLGLRERYLGSPGPHILP